MARLLIQKETNEDDDGFNDSFVRPFLPSVDATLTDQCRHTLGASPSVLVRTHRSRGTAAFIDASSSGISLLEGLGSLHPGSKAWRHEAEQSQG